MFRFESPIFLYLLLVIPVVIAVWWLSNRSYKKRVKRFGDPELVAGMMENVSKYRPKVKFWLLVAALTLLILALARPQMGTRISRDKRQGIEAIICMDISNSMLATDVVPSRLQKSKLLVENMVDKFVNDKVGLIVYAGDAFVQLPITSDYVSAKMFMHSISPSLIASQGTDIAAAINLAMLSFTPDEKAGKAIILVTDGEDHEGKAMELAKAAKEKGIRVFILGVGTEKGSTIKMPDGHYMTDNTGQTVITRLNENMCKEIAEAGSGTYIHVDNTGEAQRRLDDEIAKMQKGDVETIVYSDYAEQFQAMGIVALLLLIIEILVLERKNPLLKNVTLFNRKRQKTEAPLTKMLILVLMLSAAGTLSAQTDRQHVRNGNRLFRKGAYAEADVEYKKALSKNENNTQAIYNLGCAELQQGNDSLAFNHFKSAAMKEPNKLRKAMAFHNMGVIMQSNQQYAEAIELYKNALRNNPADNETRYNLELCKRLQKQQQQDQNDKGGGNDNQDKDKDKNKDKNKDQNKDQDKNQNKDQNKDQNQDQNKDKEQKQNEQQQISEDNAQRLLDAAVQEEKRTQDKLQKAMQQQRRKILQKNW